MSKQLIFCLNKHTREIIEVDVFTAIKAVEFEPAYKRQNRIDLAWAFQRGQCLENTTHIYCISQVPFSGVPLPYYFLVFVLGEELYPSRGYETAAERDSEAEQYWKQLDSKVDKIFTLEVRSGRLALDAFPVFPKKEPHAEDAHRPTPA